MRGKNKMMWECPVCHEILDRRDVIIIAAHITDKHPDKREAFRGSRYKEIIAMFTRNKEIAK